MLFDLRGRRRRAVQATYLMLALLMGGGLVFFGIGGDVSGGLFDAFSDNRSGGSGTDLVKKRIERNERRAAVGSEAAMKELVRSYFQLANSKADPSTGAISKEGRADLRKAGIWWERYLEAEDKPDPSLAGVAVQVFDPAGLNKPAQAQDAALIVAEATGDATAYLRVVQYAALARDKRTAGLAAKKAVDLAPQEQKKTVRAQAKELQKGAQATPQAGG